MTRDRSDQEDGAETPFSDDRVWHALVRFSRTPLSAADEAELERWASDDPARWAMVRAVQRVATLSRRPRSGRAPAAWATMRRRMADAEGHPWRRRLLGVSETRRRRGRAMATGGALAAGVILCAVVARRVLPGLDARRSTLVLEKSTGVGERADVQLEDGSHVVLGPMSQLRYGRLLGEPSRMLHLDGEGYFTVAPDPTHPFIVFAGHAAVQAVGTAFSVRAYRGDTVVEVVITHGRVALRPAAAKIGTGAIVERGEQATFDTAGFTRVVSGADVDRAIDRSQGRLSYQLVPLGTVVRDLQRWYDLDITLRDTTLERLRVTMTVDHATADDVAERLIELLDVPSERHGRSLQLGRP
jgi:ferric-dicitrate binding protein FerR (iron transport regulator)